MPFLGEKLLAILTRVAKKFTCLEEKKMEYIKTVVKSRVPNMPQVEFELVWGLCRT